ncbi:MAG: hypothetical protein ACXVW6_11605 [Nocardioidaceae bacterium]
MGKFVLVVIVFAVLVYGVLRLLERRRAARSTRAAGPGRTSGPQRRILAPDDDEDFLRGLNRRRKRSGDSDNDTDTPT